MTFVVPDAAFGGCVVRRVNDPQKLLMADFAFQRREVILQVRAEALEFGQKGVAVILQLLADLLAFRCAQTTRSISPESFSLSWTAAALPVNTPIWTGIWR